MLSNLTINEELSLTNAYIDISEVNRQFFSLIADLIPRGVRYVWRVIDIASVLIIRSLDCDDPDVQRNKTATEQVSQNSQKAAQSCSA